jgi:hypothetical protein
VLPILTTALVVKVVASVLSALIAIYAAERLGPFWGGLIAGIPSTIGPAYVILAIETTDAFVAQSALASCAGTVAILMFASTLAVAARRLNAWLVLPVAILAWGIGALAVGAAHWTIWSALAVNAVAFVVAVAITHPIAVAPVVSPPLRRHWYDILLRAGIAGGFVGIVTTASAVLGPTATGIFTVFPIVFSTLAIVLLSRMGGPVAAATFANCIWPMIPICLALAEIHACAVAWGSTVALSVGIAICLGWNAGLVAWRHLRLPSPAL